MIVLFPKFSLILFLVLSLSNHQKQEVDLPTLSAKEIVKQSDDLLRGDTNQGFYLMKITTPHWQRELKLQVFSFARNKIFIRILAPPKEAGIATLRINNEMWNYLPSVEKIIKIPPSLMLEPWMGSDFANDDLVKESSIVDDYIHKILSEEMINDKIVYKIELLPRPEAAVLWGKIIRWIRKNDFVPLKEEYYNERNKLIKILEFSDIGPLSDRIIPKVWTMTSLIKKGHSTSIKLVDVKYNQPIDENIFTMSNLKKLP